MTKNNSEKDKDTEKEEITGKEEVTEIEEDTEKDDQIFKLNLKSEFVNPPLIYPPNFNAKKHPKWENCFGVDILVDPVTKKGGLISEGIFALVPFLTKFAYLLSLNSPLYSKNLRISEFSHF